MNNHLSMEKRGYNSKWRFGEFWERKWHFLLTCGNHTVTESIAQHRDWPSRDRGQGWGKEVTAANSPYSCHASSSSGSFLRHSRNPSQPVGTACHFLLCLFFPSVGQHHEERGRLLQHPKQGVGWIISGYVIISQSVLQISSIHLSLSSMTSCVFLHGMMDFVSIHLNFKDRLYKHCTASACSPVSSSCLRGETSLRTWK